MIRLARDLLTVAGAIAATMTMLAAWGAYRSPLMGLSLNLVPLCG